MSDPFAGMSAGLSSPLIGAFEITPHASNPLPKVTRQIRVTGQGGAISVRWFDGTETVEPVAAGDVLDWRITHVRVSGTTATNLRGYY